MQSLDIASDQLQKKQINDFELFYVESKSLQLDSKDRKVDSFSRAVDQGLAIRVIHHGKMGFSFSTQMTENAIRHACNTAMEIAKEMPGDPHLNLSSFGGLDYPHADAHDQEGLDQSADQKILLAQQLEAECRQADSRITGIRSASYSESDVHVILQDASGQRISKKNTRFGLGIYCKAEQGDDAQTGYESEFASSLKDLPLSEVSQRAAKSATELLGASDSKTMKCPAILRNDVVASLVGFLSSSFSAEEIDKGRSLLHGSLDQKIFSDSISLHDDRLLEQGYATSSFDGEGTPACRTALIEKGVVKNILCDRYYAKKMGRRPTSSAARGMKSPPSIGSSNLVLGPGNTSFEKLTQDTQDGILITNLMGLHTANPITGDFSLGASGILIESGQLTRPVKGFAVSGNILQLLKQVTQIGDDLRAFHSIVTPSLQIDRLTIGGN